LLSNGLKKPYFLTIMTLMKYLLTLFLMLGINFSVLADDQDTEHTHEDNEELYGDDSCDNDIDDDMDGDVDGDDEDCRGAFILLADDDGFLGGDMSAYLVWGVGIALLNSDFGSDSGTATTN